MPEPTFLRSDPNLIPADIAQQALQYYQAKLSSLLGSFTGDDDTIKLSNSETVTLPNAASTAQENVDLPSNSQ